jgi:simple sugar transport system ATP-binding protein
MVRDERDIRDLGLPVLGVEGVSFGEVDERNALWGVSLEVRRGEALAVAGVAGNGQTLLAEVITGHLAEYAGRVTIDGRDIAGLSSRDVARLGVAYVPENRQEVGLVAGESVALNLALRDYDRLPYSRGGWVNERAMRENAERLIGRYRIRTPSAETPVGRLSGGNQQRVIIARELSGRPRLIVVDNFTRGLDPLSTEQFKAELFAHRDQGAAVVWIAGDLSEALECDRIAVMQSGQVVGVLERAEASREAIGRLMTSRQGVEGLLGD